MISTDRSYHIAYAADHNYMLYCCVSIYSLLEHFPAGSPVCVHLLLNESISSRDAALLDVLSARFPEVCFKRHLIPEEIFRDDYIRRLFDVEEKTYIAVYGEAGAPF